MICLVICGACLARVQQQSGAVRAVHQGAIADQVPVPRLMSPSHTPQRTCRGISRPLLIMVDR